MDQRHSSMTSTNCGTGMEVLSSNDSAELLSTIRMVEVYCVSDETLHE